MPWLLLLFSGVFVSAFFGVLNGVLVHFESQETDHAFVAAVLGFELFDDVALTRELHEVIEAGGLFLNRVGELAQAPILFADDLTAVSVITPRNLLTASLTCTSDRTGVAMKTVS